MKLARDPHGRSRSIGQPSQAQVAVAVASHRTRYADQLTATIWIVAAWLIGTLVSELNVVGNEPLHQERSVTSLTHESLGAAGDVQFDRDSLLIP